jgi:hypothetical protein
MWLQVLTGRDAGRTVKVAGDRFVVGREPGCDLVLRDDGIAARHALLRRTAEGRYAVEDLATPAGTFVAGRRISGALDLAGDEELCFGYTFAALSRSRPSASVASRRLIVAAAALGLALVGAVAAVLLPRTGAVEPPRVSLAAVSASPARGAVPATAAGEEAPKPGASPEVAPAAPEPPASRVLFRDDFSDPGSGWESFELPAGFSRYEGGELVVGVTDPASFATVDSGRSFRRPAVAVTVRNPGRETRAVFGVLCHYLGEGRFYALGVGANGTAAVLRRTPAGLRVVTGGRAWVRSPLVPVGAARYRLRAECAGGSLRLLVNGRPVLQTRAGAHGGSIGLFVAGEADVRFDDVVVRAIARP